MGDLSRLWHLLPSEVLSFLSYHNKELYVTTPLMRHAIRRSARNLTIRYLYCLDVLDGYDSLTSLVIFTVNDVEMITKCLPPSVTDLRIVNELNGDMNVVIPSHVTKFSMGAKKDEYPFDDCEEVIERENALTITTLEDELEGTRVDWVSCQGETTGLVDCDENLVLPTYSAIDIDSCILSDTFIDSIVKDPITFLSILCIDSMFVSMFSNLIELRLGHASTISASQLPRSLRILFVAHFHVDESPPDLTELRVNDGQWEASLPSSLLTLHISRLRSTIPFVTNSLTDLSIRKSSVKLPTSPKLLRLSCPKVNFGKIYKSHITHLRCLTLFGNLTRTDTLPQSLTTLNVDNMKDTSILPRGLLHLSTGTITGGNLPPHLLTLHILDRLDNRISLPSSLRDLSVASLDDSVILPPRLVRLNTKYELDISLPPHTYYNS